MTKFPKLSVPPMEITDPGTLRYGDAFIAAEFPEKAYKAWRATVPDFTPGGGEVPVVVVPSLPKGAIRVHREKPRTRRALTTNEKRGLGSRSFWQTLTPEQRSERQRKAAKKMWKRRRAEAR